SMRSSARYSATEHETGADENREGDRLQKRGKILCSAAGSYPAPLNERKRQYHSTGDRRREAFRDSGKNRDVFADDERCQRGTATRRQPVTPADHESGVLTHRAAQKDGVAARLRHHCSQLRQRIGAERGVQRTYNPHTNEEPRRREELRDKAWCAENPRADCVSNGHG